MWILFRAKIEVVKMGYQPVLRVLAGTGISRFSNIVKGSMWLLSLQATHKMRLYYCGAAFCKKMRGKLSNYFTVPKEYNCDSNCILSGYALRKVEKFNKSEQYYTNPLKMLQYTCIEHLRTQLCPELCFKAMRVDFL